MANPSMGANDFVNTIDPAFLGPTYEEKKIDLIVSGDTPDANWVDVMF